MKTLTLHVPASPDDVVQSDLVLPSQPDPFEAIPFGRCQLLSGTNSNAHTSYSRCEYKTTAFVAAKRPNGARGGIRAHVSFDA